MLTELQDVHSVAFWVSCGCNKNVLNYFVSEWVNYCCGFMLGIYKFAKNLILPTKLQGH